LGVPALPLERTVNFAPTPPTSIAAMTMAMSLPLPFFFAAPSWAAAMSIAMG
jgi:hypothetical protein